MFTIIVIVSIISQISIASFVLINSKKLSNWLFFLLSLSIAIWALLNYVATAYPFSDNQLTLLRLIMFFVVVQNSLYLFFSESFVHEKITFYRKRLIAYTIFSIGVSAIALSPYLFVRVEYSEIGATPTVGPGMLLFVVHAIISVFISLKILHSKYRASRGQLKRQLQLIFYASLVLWVVVPVTNLVISNLAETLFFAKISPIYTFVFTSLIAYSIIKHKLFDIRAAVARATAYLLITFFIIIVYVGAFNITQAALIPDLVITNQQLLINIALTIALVVSYPYIKQFFDKYTNKVFFKDSYDSQELLDGLNRTLVNSTELEELLTKSSLLIQESLKTSFTTFFIRSTSYFNDRIIGALRDDPTDKDAEKIQELASKLRRKVIYTETETKNADEKELVKLLKKNDIDILVRLVSTVEYEVKGIGYIFMGAKKSGSLYSKQDLKVLSIIANELVIAVENVLRFEEIEQFNVTLQKKIDDATKKLQLSNEKLKALDEAKDEFVSMASHQLRTPLTSIKGYISMVLDGDAGNVSKPQKKMLGQAFFSSQRMVYLISDLLNVSRLKTGKFIIEPKPVYLPDIVESEMLQLREGAEAKNLKLSYDKPKKFATMNLDEMKLRQVIMNFTDNAIYYTPNGGNITVSLRETAKSVEFRVKDNGIGVPKNQLHKLFTKFYRADNARKARPDGTGLGLFMAKKVIIAQGGSVILDSVEGKGSTFGFSFPKHKLEAPDVPKKSSN